MDESCIGDTCTQGAVVAEEEHEKEDDDAEEKDEGVLFMFIIPRPLSLWPENNDNEDKD